jgi:glycosyltransferase involved in cell wall biosynthesis
MRENVPVIISKQSGVAEILKHAIKVDFWDTDAIADAIFGLLKYRPAARIVVENGRREVDSLRWNDAARNLVEIYRNLYAQKFSRL